MKKNDVQKQKTEVVYVLLSKKEKTFFITRGTKETLRETYRHHINLRRYYSENFIKSIAPERPCLFVLEEIDPEEKANLMIVWLRILLENGYHSFNSETLIEYSEHLYIDNQIAYDHRKDADLSKLFECNNCLVPTYKKETCIHHPSFCAEEKRPSKATAPRKKDGRSRTVCLRLPQEEADFIRQEARQKNMSVSQYVRHAAKNPVFIKPDYSFIDEHTKQLSLAVSVMKRIAFTIDVTGDYRQSDIDVIVKLMKNAYQGELALIEKMKEKSYNVEAL